MTLNKAEAAIGNVSYCHVLPPFLPVLHALPLWSIFFSRAGIISQEEPTYIMKREQLKEFGSIISLV